MHCLFTSTPRPVTRPARFLLLATFLLAHLTPPARAAFVVFTATSEPPPASGPFPNPTIPLPTVGQQTTLYIWAKAGDASSTGDVVYGLALNVRPAAPGLRAVSFTVVPPVPPRTWSQTGNGATNVNGLLVEDAFGWASNTAKLIYPITSAELRLFATLTVERTSLESPDIPLYLQIGYSAFGLLEQVATTAYLGRSPDGLAFDTPIPSWPPATDSPMPDALITVPEPHSVAPPTVLLCSILRGRARRADGSLTRARRTAQAIEPRNCQIFQAQKRCQGSKKVSGTFLSSLPVCSWLISSPRHCNQSGLIRPTRSPVNSGAACHTLPPSSLIRAICVICGPSSTSSS